MNYGYSCYTLQHTATHCNTLLHTATHYHTLQWIRRICICLTFVPPPTCVRAINKWTMDINKWTMDIGATHCNTPQHTATHCNTLQHTHRIITCLTFVPPPKCTRAIRGCTVDAAGENAKYTWARVENDCEGCVNVCVYIFVYHVWMLYMHVLYICI